ncbi:hypothetical protein EV368DRAFT_70111 [Lentinula lateritia]|nr:hypothetical protein EV368DRAFT_70111 [Lentinula lateritia]
MLQKQDDKIDKLAEHRTQNSRMLARIGETLEKHFTSKPAQPCGNMGNEQAAKSQGDAAKTGRNPSDWADNQDNEGDDEANVAYAFSYAKKKQVPRSDKIMKGQDQTKNTVTQQEADKFAKAFKKNPLSCPCTTENFRYWIVGGPKSAWNKGASYVFVEILEKQKLITKPNVEDHHGLCEAFLVRLKLLHKYWLEDKKMVEDSNDLRLPTGRWQRKSTLIWTLNKLLHQRREVILTFESLQPYLKVFDELGIAGMLSDKEDPGMSKP